MKTGVFLLAVAGLVLALTGYEIYAWFSGKAHTISYLAYHHRLLRDAILLAILLFGAWWALHMTSAPTR